MTHTFYFDFKDGVSRRDRLGSTFDGNAGAIEHSKMLASVERTAHPVGHPDLFISVISDTGTEIHTEPVYPRS